MKLNQRQDLFQPSMYTMYYVVVRLIHSSTHMLSSKVRMGERQKDELVEVVAEGTTQIFQVITIIIRLRP